MAAGDVPPNRGDERGYYRDMKAAYLAPYLKGLAEELRQAGALESTAAFLSVVATYNARWEREMAVRFPVGVVRKWMEQVNERHAKRFVKSFARAAKVDVRPWLTDAGTPDLIDYYVSRNVDLITNLPERFGNGLADKIARAQREAPLDQARVETILKSSYRGQSRTAANDLKRICRDQVSKLNGQLTRQRQMELGITHYRWSTSQDDRVRPTHVANHGREFAWAPEEGPSPTGHPGYDIQCRCRAIAINPITDLQQRFGE